MRVNNEPPLLPIALASANQKFISNDRQGPLQEPMDMDGHQVRRMSSSDGNIWVKKYNNKRGVDVAQVRKDNACPPHIRKNIEELDLLIQSPLQMSSSDGNIWMNMKKTGVHIPFRDVSNLKGNYNVESRRVNPNVQQLVKDQLPRSSDDTQQIPMDVHTIRNTLKPSSAEDIADLLPDLLKHDKKKDLSSTMATKDESPQKGNSAQFNGLSAQKFSTETQEAENSLQTELYSNDENIWVKNNELIPDRPSNNVTSRQKVLKDPGQATTNAKQMQSPIRKRSYTSPGKLQTPDVGDIKTPLQQQLNNQQVKSSKLMKTFTSEDSRPWAVLIGNIIITALVPTLILCLGLMLKRVITIFPNISFAEMTVVPAVMFALWNCVGPVVTLLLGIFSCKTIVFAGGTLLAIGVSLSSQAYNFSIFIFSFAILGGIGSGLAINSGPILLNHYFHKNYVLATGLCLVLSSAGQIIMPHLLVFLLDRYGPDGTILLLGGILLHVCVAAMLFQSENNFTNTDIVHMLAINPSAHGHTYIINSIKKQQRRNRRKRLGNTNDKRGLEVLNGQGVLVSPKVLRLSRQRSGSTGSRATLPDIPEERELTVDCDNIFDGTLHRDRQLIDFKRPRSSSLGERNSPGVKTSLGVKLIPRPRSFSDTGTSISILPQAVANATTGNASGGFKRTLPKISSESSTKSSSKTSLKTSPRTFSKTSLDSNVILANLPCNWTQSSPVGFGSGGILGNSDSSKIFFKKSNVSLTRNTDNIVCNLRLLQLPLFVLATTSASLYTLAYPNVLLFVLMKIDAVSSDVHRVAMMLSVCVFTDMTARLFVSWLVSSGFVRPQRIFVIVGLMAFGSITGLAWATPSSACSSTISILSVFLGCFGFASGACGVVMSSILFDYVGASNYSSALMLSQVIQGLVFLTGTPLLGVILDLTNCLDSVLHVLAAIQLLSVAVWILEFVLTKKTNQKKTRNSRKNVRRL